MSPEPRATVRVTHRFSATPERVYDAFVDPKIAAKFLFATPTGTNVKSEIDARVGGAFCITDRRPDGDIDHVGTYLVLDRPRKLSFTFAVPHYSREETTVTIEIVAVEGGSELTLVHEGVLPDYAERTVGGWTMILTSADRAITG